MRMIFMILVVIGVAAGGAAYYATHMAADSEMSFRIAVVKRGNLLSTITATGTVQAEERVDVGAQVVGMIKSLGIDPSDPQKKKTVDYNSVVHEGTVLARIDDSVYKAQVNQAEALLARSNADLLQLQAHCAQAEQEWKRAESLLPAKAIADTDYDLAVANYKAAKANVAVGMATIRQNEAALELAKTNLAYTVIKSPVEGTIIDRRVDVGQTVVSSLNAPSLFLIGKDLRRIQVWASINEADIGKIHIGMPVQFTVEAYPGESFHGKVAQIRLNAMMTQNVVTYTVVVATDNSDGRLLPYLTANLQFEIEQHPGVLLVPNAALRWRPQPEQIAPEGRKSAQSASVDKDGEIGSPSAVNPTSRTKGGKATRAAEEQGHLWVADEDFVRAVDVVVGPSDGLVTEVSGENVKEGMEVVIGEQRKEDVASSGNTSPFIPQFRRGGKKPKQ